MCKYLHTEQIKLATLRVLILTGTYFGGWTKLEILLNLVGIYFGGLLKRYKKNMISNVLLTLI